MKSRDGDHGPDQPDDDDYELREYSSSPCYMHEFEPTRGLTGNRRVDSATRIIAAAPAVIYRAHLDPQALIAWLLPEGMKGRVVELIPDRLIAQVVEFQSDDPAFAGEMKVTWTFTAVTGGTEVTVRCESVPEGIRPEDHAAGLASSLENLAKYCE